jgi:hypothetical protein
MLTIGAATSPTKTQNGPGIFTPDDTGAALSYDISTLIVYRPRKAPQSYT